MSPTTRRGLAPGTSRVLSASVRPPRTPPAWTGGGDLRALVARYEAAAAEWTERFEDLDEDALTEAAVEARAEGADPVAAVDRLVRAELRALEAWNQALTKFGEDLVAAAAGRPLPLWALDAGRTGDARLCQARQILLVAATCYHHGAAGPAPDPGRPW
ncbi:hypothetical protein ACFV84_36150 [Kitasatospora sp. NPDC059811]|uniref:hypothetical protein n=1 Tax=Streptomycetaceae TaxID=2062 RepID=UPI0007AF7F3F|nr:hypothetical protein [Streptomyces sp. MJM8645]